MQSTKSGFTLVELLVVMAIVAVLGGLLMPVLSAAKQRVRVSQCAENLHQIGVSLQLYATDNDGARPPAAPQQDGTEWPETRILEQSRLNTARTQSILRQYGLTSDAWRCPEDCYMPFDSFVFDCSRSWFALAGTSYVLKLRSDNEVAGGETSTAFLAGDARWFHERTEGVRGSNVLFADMHIKLSPRWMDVK